MPGARVSTGINDRTGQRYAHFWCPGCDEVHGVIVDKGTEAPEPWGWNRSLSAPTFTPSVLVTGSRPATDAEIERIRAGEKIEPTPRRCHSFVTNGQIAFLADCTHALAGKTVDLPLVTTWRYT